MKKNLLLIIAACLSITAFSIAAPLTMAHQQTDQRYHQHISANLRPEDEVKDGTFNSHLPLIVIDTEGAEIPGDIQIDKTNPSGVLRDENGNPIYSTTEEGLPMLTVNLQAIDNVDKVNRLDDSPAVSSKAMIRIRGNSSRYFDKKGYLIRLVNDDASNNKQPLLGMDAHHEWALHGPYLDKTQIRNYMWYNISAEIMGYAPNVRFCEVVINGEYKGLYLLTEIITAGDDGARLPLSVSNNHNTFSGYLLRLDRGITELLNSFSTYTRRISNQLEIVYPGKTNITPEMEESIRQDFSAFEKSIYSYDYDNEDFGYRSQIDVTNFVDYMLINEFTCNYDAGWLSTYMYKGLDNRYRMVVWDFNNSCDNYQQSAMDMMGFEFQHCPWYVMLMKDEYFTKHVVERYRYLRTTFLSDEYLDKYIDDTIAYLGPALDRNFEVWGYSFNTSENILHPADRNPVDYEEAVSDLKYFIDVRAKWLDENIDALMQYSNECKVKKFNEDAN